jgi:hypothetical protein
VRAGLVTALVLLAVGACGEPAPKYNTSGNASRTILAGVDSGMPSTYADGGLIIIDGGVPDGGTLPTTECTDAGLIDTDGTDGTVPNLVVSELFFTPPSYIELYNRGGGSIDPAAVSFTATPSLGENIPSVELPPGKYVLAAMTTPEPSGELALLDSNGNPTFYVCWGAVASSTLQNNAITQGVWSGSGCVNAPGAGLSLHLKGLGTSPGDWQSGSPTPLACPF